MSILSIILLAISLFLAGTIAGMSLMQKIYEKAIDEQQNLIDVQEENNIRILDVNKKYGNILSSVLAMSDYASGKYIKQQIKKALDDAGKQS